MTTTATGIDVRILPTRPTSNESAKLSLLVIILLAGLGARLLLWSVFKGLEPRIVDEQSYNEIAGNLVQHGEYAASPGYLTSLRPPLYPFALAGTYELWGLNNYQMVRLLQAVLGILTAVVVYVLGRMVHSATLGLLAAAAFCFYPSLLGYANLLLTETLFTFLLSSALCALVASIKRDSLPLLAVTGVLLGLGALTRSILWLFPPVTSLYLLAFWPGSFRKRILAVLLLVAPFLATIAPWAIRNTRLQKTLVIIDVMGGRNFMMGNYHHTPLYRSWDAISNKGERAWYHEVHEANPSSEPRTQGQIDKLALRQGLKYVAEHPGQTLQRDVIKFFDFWGLERSLAAGAQCGLFGSLPKSVVVLMAIVIAISYVAVLFLAIFAMILSPPRDRRIHLLLLLVLAFVCGIHALVFGHARYHLPLMPILMLYAGLALLHRREIWHVRGTSRFWLATGLCVVLAGSWAWQFFVVDLHHVQHLIQ